MGINKKTLNISLEDSKDIVEMMSDKNIDFYQVERVDDSCNLKANKLLFDYSHKIVSMESKPTVDNYIIHYESPNKDKISIFEFVSKFRSELIQPSNITIIDDIRVKKILTDQDFYNKQAMRNLDEAKDYTEDILSERRNSFYKYIVDNL